MASLFLLQKIASMFFLQKIASLFPNFFRKYGVHSIFL